MSSNNAFPRKFRILGNTGPELHILIIMYGSRRRDSVGDERFGEHQRRVEIEFRPRLPAHGMERKAIEQWGDEFARLNYASLKHSQKWHCEFCDKPARMTRYYNRSWPDLNPPRMLSYMHFLCDTTGGPCIEELVQSEMLLEAKSGVPYIPAPHSTQIPEDCPLNASCAQCLSSESAQRPGKVCTGCSLTRYCSVECQKEHWPEHKMICKTPKTVKWVWD